MKSDQEASLSCELRIDTADSHAFSKSAAAVFAFVSALFIAARLFRLTTYSLRPDDIFSLRATRLDWTGLIHYVIQDVVHPPIFYMLLKVWVSIGGESQLWLRMLPILFGLITIPAFFLLCRELALQPAEMNLSLLLMAVNAYLIFYGQEIRMYSLLLLLTIFSMWCFARYCNAAGNDKQPAFFLFLVNLILVYTHYYGWLVVGCEVLFLLACSRRKLAKFSLSVGALVLCFAPWAYLVAKSSARRGGLGSNIGSFTRPQPVKDLGGYYATLTAPLNPDWQGFVALSLVAGALAVGLWQLYSRRGDRKAQQVGALGWLAMLAFLPAISCYAVSQVLPQSVWGFRFLIIVAVPYLILVTVGLYRLRPSWLGTAAVIMTVTAATLAGVHQINRSGKNVWETLTQRMIQTESSQSGGIMVYTFGSSDEVIRFYLEEVHDQRFETKRVTSVDEMTGDYFWVAGRESRGWSPQEDVMKRNYQVGEIYRDGFDGVLFPVWRQ